MEAVLFETGLHEGDVHITKDIKNFTNGKDVPIKPSIGGVKAPRFLSHPKVYKKYMVDNQNMFQG